MRKRVVILNPDSGIFCGSGVLPGIGLVAIWTLQSIPNIGRVWTFPDEKTAKEFMTGWQRSEGEPVDEEFTFAIVEIIHEEYATPMELRQCTDIPRKYIDPLFRNMMMALPVAGSA